MKKGFNRITAILLTAILAVNSMLIVMPTLFAEKAVEKTPVLPLSPFNANGIGGADAEVKTNTKLFAQTDSVVISSDTYLQGIIAEAPKKDNSVSSVVKVTPMMGSSAITYNYATVTHLFEKTINLTEEKGLKIETVSGSEYSVADTTASQAYANIAYSKRNSFVGADGVMFYLKIDGANIVAPNFAAFVPETAGRWTYDFDPVLMLMVGKTYSYKALNANSWTTATAIQDKEGSVYFGAMKFDSAFEGYVKIPLDSLGNDLGFKFKPNQDSFKLMCVKARGLGGKYGTITAGPYFVINKDSTSAKIEVNNASFSAAPANIGAKLSGFKQPLKDTDALLVYVKTDSANRITVSANMWDDYLGDIPSLMLKSDAVVYTAALGAEKWTKTKTVKTETDGAVQFDKAFEGYIKIPISSLKEQEASPFIAIYPEIDYITGVEISAAGIGGKFGKIEAAPFLINDDKGTTEFEISDEYKPPVVQATEVVPVMNTELQRGNWQTVTHTEVKPLDYTNATASQMTAKAAEGYERPDDITSSQAYANFKLNDISLNGYEGLVFYVKLESANTVMPQIALNIPSDTTRWRYSWDPIMVLKVGGYYEYIPITGGEWKTGTAVAGKAGSEYSGAMQFDTAFEGYIKISFDSLDNDSGFIMDTALDTVKNIVYRAKGLGGSYGQVTLGPTMLVTNDGSEGIKLKEADPIIVEPVTDVESNPTSNKVTQTVVTPLDWTDAIGLKITATSQYTNDYPANSLAYARYKTDGNFVLGDATHVIWYIKTDSANTVLPRIGYAGSELNISYDPEMTLGVGKSYSYLPIGGDKWISATSVPTWKNGNTVSNTYFGGMQFDGPFEGFVKIAVADLSNDNARINNADRATTKISNFIVSASKIGGSYGSVTAGPIFLTSNDTDSPVIKLYEAPNENADVAINATPISGEPTVKCETVTPFRGLTLQGYKVSGDSFGINTNTQLNGSNGLLIYVKTEKDAVITPNINGSFYLTAGGTYSLLSFSDVKWTKATATANGSVELEAGFEGYIRLPLTSLADNKQDNPNGILSSVSFGVESGNTMILGPISLITNVGEGTEVIYPASYDSTDPYERIQGIFERSKAGLAQGYYYMIGDSTRHLYGYPIFRIVRDALKQKYNMNCTVQALSGLKAEHWSGYTPGLDGPLFPTVEQLIEQIPGTGRNCIVDLALAINDAGKGPEKIYEFLMLGINKIREAKPEAVIVYTCPSLIASNAANKSIHDAAEMVWKDKSIYKIDTMMNVFDGYYSQYYVDTHHPNSLGYKLLGQYIVTQYVEGMSFEKIYDVDTNSYTLPSDAKPIEAELSVDATYNMTAGVYSMNVNGTNVGSIKLNGSKAFTGSAPFSTQNYIQTKLSKDITGSDYIAFYLKLPSANTVGLRAFNMLEEKQVEIIFKRDMKYYIMPLGSNKWTEKISVAGRNDDIETYGGLKFDSGFEGWVKLPLSSFYGSPSTSIGINGITFRFSELGGDYGEVRVGSFFVTNDKPYTASNVWAEKDLPVMEPLTAIGKLDSAPWVNKDYIASPLPSLTKNPALVISSSPAADYQGLDYGSSTHWVSTEYDNVPIGKYSHLAFYVKVPKTKENAFILHMWTDSENGDNGIFQIMANSSVQLLPMGETKWQHIVTERVVNSIGGVPLPAGFEGLVKISYASMFPANRVSEDARLSKIAYRFKYIGMGSERVIAGPVFGILQDNDTGPDELVYTSMPEATTIKSLYQIEDSDRFVDSVMLYWEAFEGAKYYIAEAYSITKTDTGFEYRLVSSNRCVPNSGVITDLMPGKRYAVLIKAYDISDKLLAIYDYTTVETPETEDYTYASVSDKMEYDKVYYADKNAGSSDNTSRSVVRYLVIGGVSMVLLSGAAVVFAVINKRRKKNV
ncbi:MAG: SGNH/GDSL hydrolase family protein [Clostridia bacterium]|nr:SGNH/GDSL hydrolase family protein [Clostridia bacterium]